MAGRTYRATKRHKSILYSKTPAPQSPLNLLNIPSEVRLLIYAFLFGASEPIELRVSPLGSICHVSHSISLQCLRICKKIYKEAMPFLYSINEFIIRDMEIASLPNFHHASRFLIERVLIDTCKARSTTIDFATLGNVMPGVKDVTVLNLHMTTFLTTACHLSKSLPCSPIRKWPVLELYYDEISKSVQTTVNVVNGVITTANLNGSVGNVESLIEKPRFRLSSLEKSLTYPPFKMGREMPNFEIIRLKAGNLFSEHTQALLRHKCNFGDCRFREIGREHVISRDDQIMGPESRTTSQSQSGSASPTSPTNAAQSQTSTDSHDNDNDEDMPDANAVNNSDTQTTTNNADHLQPSHNPQPPPPLSPRKHTLVRMIWSREGTIEDAKALTRRGALHRDEIARGMHRWCPELPPEYIEQAVEAGLIEDLEEEYPWHFV